MTDYEDLAKRVLDDLKQDDEQRKTGERPDPTADLDEFARRAFGNH
jgi:hypothetical protein